MPKEITHWLIAQEAFFALGKDSPLKSAIADHLNLYLTAATLPDTPYYCMGTRCSAVKEAADHFHTRQSDSFSPLGAILKQRPHLSFEAELCFFAGIISHIIADSIFHPLICSLSGPDADSQKNRARHRLLETETDLYFLKEFPFLEGRRLSTYVANMEIHEDDLAFLTALLFGLDGESFHQIMKRSLQHHCLVQSLFYKCWPLAPLILGNSLKTGSTEHLLNLSYIHVRKKPSLLSSIHGSDKKPIADTMEQLKNSSTRTILDIFSTCLEKSNCREDLKNNLGRLAGPNLITGDYPHRNSAEIALNQKSHDNRSQ